ncbi:hypothetical protein HanPI659440_Chr16g0619361 [Helianthus annuus]|nr:hypothetical protein HanPI659440_Chr16g0619361 [Helianthus annuus]
MALRALLRSTTVAKFRHSITTNGSDGYEKAFVDPTSLKLLGIATNVSISLYERLFYGYAKPEMKRNDEEEIVFEIPVQGVTKDEIRMFVNEKNVFVLESSNKQRCYSHQVKLPVDANFEKAVFKPVELKLGLVRVTVKNFKRKQVEVKFPEGCGGD